MGIEADSVGLMSAWVVRSAGHAPIFMLGPHLGGCNVLVSHPMITGNSLGPPPCGSLQTVPLHTRTQQRSFLTVEDMLVPGDTESLHFGTLQHLPMYVDRLLTTH